MRRCLGEGSRCAKFGYAHGSSQYGFRTDDNGTRVYQIRAVAHVNLEQMRVWQRLLASQLELGVVDEIDDCTPIVEGPAAKFFVLLDV